MSSILLYLVVAAIPAAFLLAWIVRLDRKRPEPIGLIGRSVLYGFLAVAPAATIELALARAVPPLPGVWEIAFEAFVGAALVEEGTKLFFVKRYLYKRPEFDEYADGIVYAICVSLGFAFVENFIYGWRNLGILLARAFTAVPGHAVFSGIMGYYVGQSKLDPSRPGAWAKGLAWAILLHGLYDAFLMSGTWAAFLVLPLLALGSLALRRLFKEALRRDDEAERAAGGGIMASYQRPEPPIL